MSGYYSYIFNRKSITISHIIINIQNRMTLYNSSILYNVSNLKNLKIVGLMKIPNRGCGLKTFTVLEVFFDRQTTLNLTLYILIRKTKGVSEQHRDM